MQFTTTALLAALALTASALPSPHEKRFVPGQCGVHLQQFQRNEGPGSDTSSYRFTITLKDAIGEPLGGASVVEAPSGQGVDVDSQLPNVFIATAGYVDSDPVSFAYGGQQWDSSGGCSVGGYDGGSRQMDCGFSC